MKAYFGKFTPGTCCQIHRKQGPHITSSATNNGTRTHRTAYQTTGTCYSCGKFGHEWIDYPLAIPPKEASGYSRTTNAVTSTQTQLHNNQQDPPQNSPQQQPCLADAEFMLMFHLYQSADVTTVTGAIDPIYFVMVTIGGTQIRALVDPGSSATIMSFKLFHKIGHIVHIPASALQKPDIMLRDYSQSSITIVACVQLMVLFQYLSVTVSVYVRIFILMNQFILNNVS